MIYPSNDRVLIKPMELEAIKMFVGRVEFLAVRKMRQFREKDMALSFAWHQAIRELGLDNENTDSREEK